MQTEPLENRGRIQHLATRYGYSLNQVPLDVVMPQSSTDLLMFAGIHGEEPESTVLLSKALRMLPGVPKHCAVILAANPDGLLRGTRGNANGVDLNRNFPASNWQEAPVYHRWKSGDRQNVPLSSGSHPASEPETQALMALIDQLQPKQIVAIHAPLACIDDPLASDTAQWMAEKTGLPLVADVGDPTPGSFGSWCAEQSYPVITYELPVDSVWNMMDVHLEMIVQLLMGDYPRG